MFLLPPRFVLFDTEYTAWEKSKERNWSDPGEFREIIQIGAICVSGRLLTEEATFVRYVRPLKNPLLSAFITSLTGISQAAVEKNGVPLQNAMADLRDFIGDLPAYAYGHDASIIKENCDLIGIPFPLADVEVYDLRELMEPILDPLGISQDSHSSGTLLTRLGKSTTRPAHDALNDMRNLRDALFELKERGLMSIQ